MNIEQYLLQQRTRRHFFRESGLGIGKMALASLAVEAAFGKGLHHPAKIDHVIFLFMAGAPSQLELFDYKPELTKYDGKVAPEEYLKGKRFAFMDTFAKEPPKMLGTRRKFERHGKSGIYISELLPNIAKITDELTLIHGLSTENFNHGPAKLYTNTGSARNGRPSMGSWIPYGIGNDSKNHPGFVLLERHEQRSLPEAISGIRRRPGGELAGDALRIAAARGHEKPGVDRKILFGAEGRRRERGESECNDNDRPESELHRRGPRRRDQSRGVRRFAAEIGFQLQHLSKRTITQLAPNRLSWPIRSSLPSEIIGLEQQGGLMRFRSFCTSAVVAARGLSSIAVQTRPTSASIDSIA